MPSENSMMGGDQGQTFALSPEVSVALGHFISAVTSAPSEQSIYATLAQNLKDLLPNDRASVTLLNEAEDQLDIFSLHGRDGVLPLGKSLPLADTYTGWAVARNEGQLHQVDAGAETLDGQLLRKEGMRSIINVPLVVHGTPIGAINAATSTAQGFNPRSLQLLQLVSRLVSTSLERQRLLEERKKAVARYRFYATQLENLNQLAQRLSTVMSVAETLRVCGDGLQSIMPSQRISYASYEPDYDRFEVTVLSAEDVLNRRYIDAADTGLERVMAGQESLYFFDLETSPYTEHRLLYEKGMRSGWSLPVRIEGRVVAVLNAATSEKGDDDIGKQSEVLGTLGAVLGSTLERLKVQDKLVHQVNHDTVTGLPNRRMLYRQINQRIARHVNGRGEQHFSVLFVDLDHFKAVNDTCGHQVGDELLCLVAKRIRHVIRETDLVARVGGDEFIVLTDDSRSAGRSSETAERIIQALSRTFDINGASMSIGASIGISHSCARVREADELIRAADRAMYDAKSAGRNRYCIHQPSAREAPAGK